MSRLLKYLPGERELAAPTPPRSLDLGRSARTAPSCTPSHKDLLVPPRWATESGPLRLARVLPPPHPLRQWCRSRHQLLRPPAPQSSRPSASPRRHQHRRPPPCRSPGTPSLE